MKSITQGKKGVCVFQYVGLNIINIKYYSVQEKIQKQYFPEVRMRKDGFGLQTQWNILVEHRIRKMICIWVHI